MRRAVLLVLLIAAAPSAHAASFDCARAATVTERAICASQTLSALDERAVAAYTDAVNTLGLSDDPREPAGEMLVRGHEEWSAARNRCGGVTNCLLQQYLRRVAVLDFKPDSQAHGPADALVGRYGTSIEPARELLIMAAPGGAVLVHVGINSAGWTCSFTGVGRLDRAGILRVVRVDFDGTTQGDHAILLTPTRLGLAVVRASARDDVSTRFCGAGGSLEQPFPRRD